MDWSGGMDFGMENGMFNWWQYCVLDSFNLSFQILKNLLYRKLDYFHGSLLIVIFVDT